MAFGFGSLPEFVDAHPLLSRSGADAGPYVIVLPDAEALEAAAEHAAGTSDGDGSEEAQPWDAEREADEAPGRRPAEDPGVHLNARSPDEDGERDAYAEDIGNAAAPDAADPDHPVSPQQLDPVTRAQGGWWRRD